jgi:tRNA dimethylallyltransferase
VGKSKLAVELALSLTRAAKSAHPWRGARIINADSMQVYTGMDVITNKMPRDERQGVEHLLMDFKPPGEQYVVGEWVNDAIQAVGTSRPRLDSIHEVSAHVLLDQRDSLSRSGSDRCRRYCVLDAALTPP